MTGQLTLTPVDRDPGADGGITLTPVDRDPLTIHALNWQAPAGGHDQAGAPMPGEGSPLGPLPRVYPPSVDRGFVTPVETQAPNQDRTFQYDVGNGLPDITTHGNAFERAAQLVPQLLGLEASEVARNVQGTPAALWDAATLPGDVYTGKVDPFSPEGLDRTTAMAMTMTNSPVGPAPAVGEASFGSFNSPYYWRWRKASDGGAGGRANVVPGSKMASFYTENPDGSLGNEYKVYAEPYNDGKAVDLTFLDANNRFDLTGSSPGAAQRIFATAMDVAKNYVDNSKNKSLQELTFEAKADEPSRVRLYRMLAHRFSKGQFGEKTQTMYDYDTGDPIDFVKFSVPVKKD